MEINSVREFRFPDGTVLPLTVVRDMSAYRENDTIDPQLVRTYEIRAYGSVNVPWLEDVETDERFTVTKLNTKFGFTYLTVQERNMGF